MTVTGFQHIGSYLQQHCTAAATEDMACDDMKWLKLHILMCAEKLEKLVYSAGQKNQENKTDKQSWKTENGPICVVSQSGVK